MKNLVLLILLFLLSGALCAYSQASSSGGGISRIQCLTNPIRAVCPAYSPNLQCDNSLIVSATDSSRVCCLLDGTAGCLEPWPNPAYCVVARACTNLPITPTPSPMQDCSQTTDRATCNACCYSNFPTAQQQQQRTSCLQWCTTNK